MVSFPNVSEWMFAGGSKGVRRRCGFVTVWIEAAYGTAGLESLLDQMRHSGRRLGVFGKAKDT